MQFFQVPLEMVERLWPSVQNLIAEACERSAGRFTADGYRKRILRGEQQLWIATGNDLEAVIVTELATYHDTGLKVARALIGVGRNRENWLPLVRAGLVAWGREQGCSKIEIVARPGWERALPEYRKTHVFLEQGL